jgi:DNA-binding transcriptional MerR regulator
MLINEVCKRCGLTKKAIEYYEEQGLTRPQIMENGYRVFSEDDVIPTNFIFCNLMNATHQLLESKLS